MSAKDAREIVVAMIGDTEQTHKLLEAVELLEESSVALIPKFLLWAGFPMSGPGWTDRDIGICVIHRGMLTDNHRGRKSITKQMSL